MYEFCSSPAVFHFRWIMGVMAYCITNLALLLLITPPTNHAALMQHYWVTVQRRKKCSTVLNEKSKLASLSVPLIMKAIPSRSKCRETNFFHELLMKSCECTNEFLFTNVQEYVSIKSLKCIKKKIGRRKSCS